MQYVVYHVEARASNACQMKESCSPFQATWQFSQTYGCGGSWAALMSAIWKDLAVPSMPLCSFCKSADGGHGQLLAELRLQVCRASLHGACENVNFLESPKMMGSPPGLLHPHCQPGLSFTKHEAVQDGPNAHNT